MTKVDPVRLLRAALLMTASPRLGSAEPIRGFRVRRSWEPRISEDGTITGSVELRAEETAAPELYG
jgi:hypothetical protein